MLLEQSEPRAHQHRMVVSRISSASSPNCVMDGRRQSSLLIVRPFLGFDPNLLRDILSRALKERSDSDKVQMHLVEADIYLDQISVCGEPRQHAYQWYVVDNLGRRFPLFTPRNKRHIYATSLPKSRASYSSPSTCTSQVLRGR